MGSPVIGGATGSGAGLVLHVLSALDIEARLLTAADPEIEAPGRLVLCLRHPLETALSPAEWRREMQRLRAMAAPARRVVVHYEALLREPRAELARLVARLGHRVPGPALTAAAARVAPERRRRRATVQELFHASIPDDVAALYFDLCAEAGPAYHRTLQAALALDIAGALGPSQRDGRRVEIDVADVMARLRRELASSHTE
jgi:hypothetical protein